MKNKITTSILLSFIMTGNAFGNINKNSIDSENDTISKRANAYNIDMPNYISMSPEMAGLFRFIEYDGDLSSGVMTTSIPIYEIKCGPLNLPLSLAYEASGRRMSEVTGQIGIGWTLNAGGAIARTIKGNPDMKQSIWPTEIRKMTMSEIKEKLYSNEIEIRKDYHNQLEEIANGYFDSEYDFFSYTIPGHSGYFIAEGSKVIILSEDPVKIKCQDPEDWGTWNIFSITDDKGNVYLFNTYDIGNINTGAMEWRLSEIYSIDKQYTIKFKYERLWIWNEAEYTAGETATVTDCRAYCDFIIDDYCPPYIDDCFLTSIYQQRPSPINEIKQKWIYRLSEIEFNSGKIKFDNNQSDGVLNSIIVKDNNDKTLRSLVLSHSELEIGKKWLNAIEWLDSSNISIEKYHFEYYPTSSLIYSKSNLCASDYWGFRNRTIATDWMPIVGWEIIEFRGVQIKSTSLESWRFREPDYREAQKGIMKKITYPTGGTTEYSYEGNSYWSYVSKKKEGAGGIRIKEITTVTEEDSIKTKFEYSSGRLLVDPKNNMRRSISDNIIVYTNGYQQYPETRPCSFSTIYKFNRVHTFSSEFVDDEAFLANIPVFYNSVIKYNVSRKKGLSTKIIYKYSERYNELLNSQMRHSHTRVSETSIWMNLDFINTFSTSNFLSPDSKPYIPFYSYFWKKTNLLEEKHFINDGQDNYIPLKTTSYEYAETPIDTIKGLKVERFFILSSINPSEEAVTEFLIKNNCRFPFFYFADYYISKGKTELVSKKETYHDSGVKTTTTYEYACHEIQDIYSDRYGECDYSYLRATNLANSEGDTIREEMMYPFDLCNQNNVYQQMLTNNIISPIVEQSQYKNGVFIQKQKTNYKNWGNDLFLPEIIQSQTNKQSDPEPRITYHAYDKYGNPVYISKDNATKVVYLWSYGGQYAVAEIKNATYEEVSLVLGKDFIDNLSSQLVLSDTDKKKIDDLRSKLPGSLVSTYTYKPLVGRLTASDPRGLTIYYEYDAFGRLKCIKDHNGKKIEDYDYIYRNN